MRMILSACVLFFAPLAVLAAPGSVAVVPSGNLDALQVQLRNALIEARPKLGSLESWQVRVFEEEALPQYQRFIRDYRPSGNSFAVEVDLDALKNYLRFRASKESSRVLVFLKGDPACGKCTQEQPGLKQLVASRLERRGLIPVWMTPEELVDTKLSGKALDEKINTLATQRLAAGALVVQWAPLVEEDVDSAHADENRYYVHSFLSMKELTRAEGRLELLDTGTFTSALARLLTDAFTELGAKGQAVKADAVAREEILLELSGFTDFAQYSRIKEDVLMQLPDITALEERKLARGRAVFAVTTQKSKEELKQQVSRLKSGNWGGKAVLEVQ